MTFRARRVVDGIVRQRTTDINYSDLWHEQVKPIDAHEEAQGMRFPSSPVREEGQSPKDGKGRGFGRIGHDPNCDCYRCEHARNAYTERPDLSDTLKRRQHRVLSMAFNTDPAKASDLLKRFHQARTHYSELQLKAELALQCEFMATLYDMAARILWSRMVHHATHKAERVRVKAKSAPGTIGRTAITEDDLWTCPQCADERGFAHCEVTGCNTVAKHGPRCNEHRRS